jgi:serine/threonine-protein kinase RsbW
LRQDEVTLKVPNSPAYVSVVRHAVASLARKMAFSEYDVGDIQLAVGEACNNAVKHGLEDGSHPVRVRCKIAPTDLCVEVTNRYDGAPPSGAIGCKPEPCGYNEGGMGVFLMNTLVDSVRFRWGKRTATVSLTKIVRTS